MAHQRRVGYAETVIDFPEFVRGKSVAIVGNAPHILELPGNGHRIDSHDIVIRCNRFSLSRDHAQVAGQRIDVWASSFFIGALRGAGAMIATYRPQMAIACIPPIDPRTDMKHVRDTEHAIHDLAFSLPIVRVPADIAARCYREIGSRPTTGAMVTHYVLSLPAKSIYLTGFSFSRGERVKYYFEQPHADTGVHDPAAEGEYLRREIQGRNDVQMDRPILQL